MFAAAKEVASLMTIFAPLFSKRVWPQVQTLVVGAILAPGKRTITTAWRVMGLAQATSCQQSNRVLNRTVWSRLEGSRLSLLLLVRLRAPMRPRVMGRDDTLERRRGAKIHAQGLSRESVRSSHSQLVKASGLRWLSLLVLGPMPWAKRGWAVPLLTVLAPSEHDHQERRQRHQKLTDWARQMLLVGRRWLPERSRVLVTHSRVAGITWLWPLSRLLHPLCGMTRWRLDAARYEPAPPR